MCTEPFHGVLAAPWNDDDVERGEPIPLEPIDQLTVTSLVDNAFDLLLPDEGPVQRASSRNVRYPRLASPVMEEGSVPDTLVAEHGFSVLLEVTRGGRTSRVLFDAGRSPDGMVENLRRLDLDPRDVDVIVFSHGHYDHTTGIDGFIRTVGRRNLPVLLHPHFWNRRRTLLPGRDPIDLPTTSRTALQDAGFDLIERPEPSFLLDGALLVTGEVDRTTEFEQGNAYHQARREGTWHPDPLILDDQAIVANVRGVGLVVLTGCGHAGAVNILRYARRLTGIDHVHAFLGGMHLGGRQFAPVIAPTVQALTELEPDWVIPGHCTGWSAMHQLATALPDAVLPNHVGSRYTFAAAA